MNDKIKELTEKIHRDGFEKANKEAETIISNARKESEEIIKEAEKKAEAIIEDAKKQASEETRRIEADIRLSSKQALLNLKMEISDLIQASVLKDPVKEAFDDHQFIKKILESLVEKWNPSSEDNNLHLMIDKNQLAEMDAYLKEKAGRMMNKGIELDQYKGSGKGFEIEPVKGHYKINVTDEAFEIFLKEHFKPGTLEFLYGGEEK